MRELFYLGILIASLIINFTVSAQEEQETPEEAYTRVITGRADKIVNGMEFSDSETKIQVRDEIVDFYRSLSAIHDTRDAKVEELKKSDGDNTREINALKNEANRKVASLREGFISKLDYLINAGQIDRVKDGLTYNVAPNTYKVYCDMIPSLTEKQKAQIWEWLVEARDSAMVGGSSEEKHWWFGKYKGKINNFLSKEGYDLKEEERKWAERRKSSG